jgi:uncharacterized membrane protein YraQ (UPF0718 family)
VSGSLEQSLRFFGVVAVELVVLYVAVSAGMGLMREYGLEVGIRRALEKRRGWGNVLGAALGFLTPFCSFSTIPIMVGLLRAGVPFGAVISFLFASPLVNPVVLGLFLVLFGWRVALVYAVAGFGLAVLSGVLWEWLGLRRYVRLPEVPAGCGERAAGGGFALRLARSLRFGWWELRRALPYLAVGLVAGALVYGFMPSEWVVRLVGPENPLAVPVAAAVAAPLYVWPETMLPLGAALLERGMGIGVVMALVVGGAGASIPELGVLASIFRGPLLAVFVANVLVIAVLVGYGFNGIFP